VQQRRNKKVMKAKTVREVVELLRADSSEALLELAELEHAIGQLFVQIGDLVVAAREAQQSAEVLTRTGPLKAEAAFTLAHTDRVLGKAEHIEASVREIHRGVAAWSILTGESQEN
jgi:hypothetical protein